MDVFSRIKEYSLLQLSHEQLMNFLDTIEIVLENSDPAIHQYLYNEWLAILYIANNK